MALLTRKSVVSYVITLVLLCAASFAVGAFVFPKENRRVILLDDRCLPDMMPSVDSTHQVEGPSDASLTVVEYSDLQCPFSIRNHSHVTALLQRYAGAVRYCYKHFPLPRHKEARLLARAVLAAQAQGKGVEMREWLYGLGRETRKLMPDSLAWETLLLEQAVKMRLDTAGFRGALHSPRLDSLVVVDFEEGQRLGVRSTPTVFINGNLVKGAVGQDGYRAVIEKLTHGVSASGVGATGRLHRTANR